MTSGRGMSGAVHTNASILTINARSSTIKFALFQVGQPLARVSSGKIERIGLGDGVMTVTDHSNGRAERVTVQCPDHAVLVNTALNLLKAGGQRCIAKAAKRAERVGAVPSSANRAQPPTGPPAHSCLRL